MKKFLFLLFAITNVIQFVNGFSRIVVKYAAEERKPTSKNPWHTRFLKQERGLLSLFSESNENGYGGELKDSRTHYIRRAKYKDLREAVGILIDAFYKPSAVIRPYLFLSELSRLQLNFPYNICEHSFFVACTMVTEERDDKAMKEEKIIGFVDVDTRRVRKISDAPRPYLSDLAVHKEHRRQGVAKSLIKFCEDESIRWGKKNLYLRVEEKNNGALAMYSDLGYERMDHPYFGVKDTTILLKKDHVPNVEEESVEVQSITNVTSLEYSI
uniref:N-acetyltransferase domain-containing protein n=2 Tax=Chaetoceros debilis TaxID=122233 RepID=A0A7S3V7G1_9STRA|mmetsp:Transcript_10715/g.16262  ORF Transcript_10715/g.16262 Transcript_10715/m.16262 type:complete len:270 (-) Transcript_10715:141-950(-)